MNEARAAVRYGPKQYWTWRVENKAIPNRWKRIFRRIVSTKPNSAELLQEMLEAPVLKGETKKSNALSEFFKVVNSVTDGTFIVSTPGEIIRGFNSERVPKSYYFKMTARKGQGVLSVLLR